MEWGVKEKGDYRCFTNGGTIGRAMIDIRIKCPKRVNLIRGCFAGESEGGTADLTEMVMENARAQRIRKNHSAPFPLNSPE